MRSSGELPNRFRTIVDEICFHANKTVHPHLDLGSGDSSRGGGDDAEDATRYPLLRLNVMVDTQGKFYSSYDQQTSYQKL